METHKALNEILQNTLSQATPTGTTHAFSDANLSQLRDQIKKIMIPKLIRVFELKLAIQQASMPPSRITGQRPDSNKLFEIQNELTKLHEDVKLLILWSESCQKQVLKALDQVEAAIKSVQ